MIMKAFMVFFVGVASVVCQDTVKIQVSDKRGYGSDTELVNIDLKHADVVGNEIDDIKIQVKIYFHLVDKKVHCNGVPLQHGKVTHLHLQMVLQEFHSGEILKDTREVPVELRVLVGENVVNGKNILFVEEQFLMIDDHKVTQITIQKVMWNNLEHHGVIPVPYENSQLSQHNSAEDEHVHRGRHFNMHHARLPGHPFSAENKDEIYEPKHYHHSITCWFHHLNQKSKIAVVSTGIFALLTLLFAISCCVRRRKMASHALAIETPLDDTIDVQVDANKKVKDQDDKLDFHFNMDNVVVVDDKKQLIEA